MMAKDAGGQAFPVLSHPSEFVESYGMTLRDYFAAKAMAALINRGNHDGEIEKRAEHAYKCADAMLAERGK